ncbi:MAG: cobalamin B12-binding domain-containing protein, partial [Clostridiales bacterium]|nr:cobalamin B12-binding domain-containing protein [Clostridiales bacterium]
GWAMMEYYIANDLIGAKLAPCFGNLIDDPMTRMSTITCLDEIHKHECVGSMAYGDTISPTKDQIRNLATTASYVINDIVMQMHTPTGHAINPLPVTEVIRIPTPEENVQAQMIGAQLKVEAERQYLITDFSKIEERAHFTLENSKKFFNRILDAFSDVIDVTDPLKLVYGLKQLGADNLESMFSNETPNTGNAIDRKPYIETGMYKMITSMIENTLAKTEMSDSALKKLNNKKAVVACTDVHQYGKMIVGAVLRKAGVEVTDIGCNADTDDIVKCIADNKPDFIVLSTYNGLALSYAKDLKAKAEKTGVWGSTPIFMGGRLNDDAGCEVPIDVTKDLEEMGFYPSDEIESLITLIDRIL